MGKKREFIRPDSYALNDYSAGHLRMLLDRLSDFIKTIKPAIDKAQKNTPEYISEKHIIKYGTSNQRYVNPNELHDWLIHKKTKLAEFIEKVEAGERNLSDKPLNNIRHIRAFFARFESIAKTQYNGVSIFKSVEPGLSKILLEKLVPARSEGGIFEITRHLLKDESFHSKKDLGKIRDDLRVGKTITYIVAAQIKLTQQLQPPLAEVDGLAYLHREEPVAAAISKAIRELPTELALNDARKKPPTKFTPIKPKRKPSNDQQQLLNLR